MSMSKIDVLLVGGGGREHALTWQIAGSPLLGKLYAAPGNAGTAEFADNVPLKATDIAGLLAFAKEKKIGLTVFCPEDPLIAGAVDVFQKAGLLAFGPSQAAARVEGSKIYAKCLMRNRGVPTAPFAFFSDYNLARAHLEERRLPVMIKADGAALGKGARKCSDMDAARRALHEMMVDKIYGAAGEQVVIEDCLSGPEVSLHAFCDGRNYRPWLSAQDHKGSENGNLGDMTGGMGAYAPVPWFTPEMIARSQREIFEPTLAGMVEFGTPYRGVLYPGLMMTKDGPRVLEFNCRKGDPENQVLMMQAKSDMLAVMLAVAQGRINEVQLEWRDGYAVGVVMASGGYPKAYQKGYLITGIEEAEKIADLKVFLAGVAEVNGQFYTDGGRVLCVTARGATIPKAIEAAYAGVACIKFQNAHFRPDIGAGGLTVPAELAL